MRNLDFTVCTRDCTTKCWRKLTEEEKDWLEKNPNRQSYASFDDCEDYSLSIAEQCRRAGIAYTTYYSRLKKGEKDLFAKPLRKRMTKELLDLLAKNGISKQLYHARVHQGWSEFEAANVLPNSHICYYHNGKSVHSQLCKGKYEYFKDLVNIKGMSIAQAFEYVTK